MISPMYPLRTTFAVSITNNKTSKAHCIRNATWVKSTDNKLVFSFRIKKKRITEYKSITVSDVSLIEMRPEVKL